MASGRSRTFLPTLLSLGLMTGLSLWVMCEILRLSAWQWRHERQVGAMALLLVNEILLPDQTLPADAAAKTALVRLQAVADDADIVHARIEIGSNTPLRFGTDPLSLAPRGPAGSRHLGQHLQVWDTFLLLAPPGTSPSHSALARLVLVLDAKNLTLQGADRLPLIALLLGCGWVVVFLVAWSMAVRNRQLQLQLEAVRAGKEHHEELSLAAAGLAHETKNPLGVIRGLAQQIADDPAHADTARRARDIMEEADVTTDRLGDFLQYARVRKPEPQPLAAAPHLERVAGLVADEFRAAAIDFRREIEPVFISADPEMLSQVVVNLLLNSLKHTPANGTVTLRLRRTGAAAELLVADSGTGIPKDLLPNLFKPYVGRRGGHGLGLAIVKRIADQSGWKVALDSNPGQGTTVTIRDIPLIEGTRP